MSSRTVTAALRPWVVLAAAALVGGAISAVSSACITESNPEPFAGGDLGYCAPFTAKQIPAGECRGCGGSAYALCNGMSFGECACDLPSDYSLDAGTFEASFPLISEGGVTQFDAALFDFPCCVGNTALEIPSSICPSHCTENIAYVLCVDNVYTECACDMPPGFTLPTVTCDGG